MEAREQNKNGDERLEDDRKTEEEKPEKTQDVETQGGKGEDQDYEEGDLDHPADRLTACVEEILSQEKRLSNRNAGNLKYELVNNIYPLMRTAFSALIDYMDGMDGDEEDEEVEKAIQESLRVGVENCQKLVALNESIGGKLKEIMSEEERVDYDSVIDWARKSIEQAESQMTH